ncbi:Hpt domain-containing protein [Exiguobacterium flavidum]|uniref:Hpt domain-containing protein n=1 Tax=Exiguobacterium flavidum TaxID=2184695 RepID=UPI000DF7D456|nr:Hpt domain-containing protein [Exiguobacterium flavidum]
MPYFNDKKLEELRAIANGDEAFLRKIGETYIIQFDKKYPELVAAVENRDIVQTEKLAHLLKGASYSVAADDLADFFESLEKRAEQGSLDGAEETIEAIDSCMVDFRVVWFDAFIGNANLKPF